MDFSSLLLFTILTCWCGETFARNACWKRPSDTSRFISKPIKGKLFGLVSLKRCKSACLEESTFTCVSVFFVSGRCDLYSIRSTDAGDNFIKIRSSDSGGAQWDYYPACGNSSTSGGVRRAPVQLQVLATATQSQVPAAPAQSQIPTSPAGQTCYVDQTPALTQVPDQPVSSVRFNSPNLVACESSCTADSTCKSVVYDSSRQECATFRFVVTDSGITSKVNKQPGVTYAEKQTGSACANSQGNCFNQHKLCNYWAFYNECGKNRNYMFANCALACGFCGGANVAIAGPQQQSYGAGGSNIPPQQSVPNYGPSQPTYPIFVQPPVQNAPAPSYSGPPSAGPPSYAFGPAFGKR